MLSDGSFHEKIMEIKVKDKGLFNTIKRFFEKMIANFTKVYEKLTPDQKDAQDIRAMKDMFDKIQMAFAEALVKASDNFQATKNSKEVIESGNGNRYSSRYEKRFFPGIVFPSGQTHTAVTECANRKDTKTDDKRLVFYRGEYYRVGKFDDMDFGYLVTKKYDAQDYKEDLREYGEIDSEESVQSGLDEIVARSGETTEYGQRGYYADPAGNGHGREDNSLRKVAEEQHGW